MILMVSFKQWIANAIHYSQKLQFDNLVVLIASCSDDLWQIKMLFYLFHDYPKTLLKQWNLLLLKILLIIILSSKNFMILLFQIRCKYWRITIISPISPQVLVMLHLFFPMFKLKILIINSFWILENCYLLLSFHKFLNLLIQENLPFDNIRFLANEINLANILTSKINRFITV